MKTQGRTLDRGLTFKPTPCVGVSFKPQGEIKGLTGTVPKNWTARGQTQFSRRVLSECATGCVGDDPSTVSGPRGSAGSGRTAATSHVQSRTPAGQGVHWLSGVGWWPAVRCVNTKLDKGSVFSHRSYLVMSGQGPAHASCLLRLCKARRAGAIR